LISDPLVPNPDVYQTQPVPLVALVVVLIGLLPAWLAPLPQEPRPLSGGDADV